MPSPSLLQRLKERKLVQWGLAYLAGAWVLAEVADVVGGRWNLPDTLFQGFFIVLGVGFFITLVLAWYHGEKGRQRVSGPELLMVAALLVVAGVALSSVGNGRRAADPARTKARGPGEDEITSIAVLPPESLSEDPADLIFSDGIHEELLNALAGIGGLGVTARTSVLLYRTDPKPVREVVEELGVDAVVEWSIRRAGESLRVTVQLIDGTTEQHLWSDNLDREFSAADLFALQSDIARQIAGGLRIQLTGEEESRLLDGPTENTEAYELFLRAASFGSEHGPSATYQQVDLLRQTVRLDPDFGAAWATLARALVFLVGNNGDLDLVEEANRSLDMAKEIAPGEFETIMARAAWAYYVPYDLAEARAFLDEAERLRPSDIDYLTWRAFVERRAGNWEVALNAHEEALKRDPFSSNAMAYAQYSYWRTGQLQRAIELDERLLRLYSLGAARLLRRKWFILQNLPAVESYVDSLSLTLGSEAKGLLLQQFASLEKDLPTKLSDLKERAGNYREKARLCFLLENPVCQKAYGDSLISQQEQLLEEVDQGPLPTPPYSRARRLMGIGIGHAFAGNRTEALNWGAQALAIAPPSVDAFDGPFLLTDMAEIHMVTGDRESAVEYLRQCLEIPCEVRVPTLRTDPLYGPIRDDPRFQALLEKYAGDVEH